MGMLIQNLRYAVRTLVRAPGFTLTVVATLALGIGANTAIFSVVDGVLLERLPFHEAEQLVTVWQDVTQRGGPEREWFNYPMYEDLRDEPGLMESAGIWGGWNPTFRGATDAQVLQAAEVSYEMFPGVLRVMPSTGRMFIAADDVAGAPPVVMLSHALWQSHFAGDPNVVGRSISLSEEPYTIIGVMPEGFKPPFIPDAALWRGLGPSETLTCPRGCYVTRVVARLAAGVTLEGARARAAGLAARLEESFPETNTNVGLAIFGLREDLTRNASRGLWVLLGAVGFVLLIACTNVANLLLARGASRRGEFAVRVALGAGRGPIIGQLLTESLILAAAGGLLGFALASWGVDILLEMAPPGAVPRLDQVALDDRVLGFTALVTLATGLVFGLLPAWTASGEDVQSTIRSGTQQGRAGTTLRGGLAVTQVALAMVLLVGAGLLMRSFQGLHQAELGFEPAGVLALSMALPDSRYEEDSDRQAFYDALLARMGSLPRVTAVGAVSSLPLAGADSDASFLVDGEPPPDPGLNQAAWIRPVTDGYFEAMGIELVEGRGFAAGDDAEADRVILVNEALARRYFPSGDAVGRRIGFGGASEPNWRTIVGVVGDVRHFGIRNGTRPAVYFPYKQVSFPGMSFVLRADGDLEGLVPGVREAISGLDPALAATHVQPLRALVDVAMAPDRFVTFLLSTFAVAAMLLAAVGIYGVISYGVTWRMREMGIRLALGADGGAVRRMVVRGGLFLAGGGVLLGVLGAMALGRVMGTLLFEVESTDPLTYVAVALLVASIALVASWLPARRAGKADPVLVLREE
jgi:predicted permease